MAAEHSLTGPIVKISFLLSIVQNTKISANAVPMTLSHSTGYKKLVQIMILNIILHLCSVKHLKFEYFSQSPVWSCLQTFRNPNVDSKTANCVNLPLLVVLFLKRKN